MTEKRISAIHILPLAADGYPTVQQGISLANTLLGNDFFYRSIAALPYFEGSDILPFRLSELMRTTKIRMRVALYSALDPHAAIDTYDDPIDPSRIPLNLWNAGRTAGSICNSLVHACVHAVNSWHAQYRFGHAHIPKGRLFHTAPYRIGALAEELTGYFPSVLPQYHHDPEPPVYAMGGDTDVLSAFAQSMWCIS